MLAFYVTPTADGFRVQQSADGRPKYSELLSVRAYREIFPQSTNIYHPHEAAADLFAKLVVFDSYLSARMNDAQRAEKEKSFGPLREWFRKNLGKTIATPEREVQQDTQTNSLRSMCSFAANPFESE